MKKIYFFILLSILLTFSASQVNAQTLTGTSSGLRTTVPSSTSNATSKLKEQMQILRDQKQTAVSKIREEEKVMIQAKRDEFKVQMQTIKDQRKKTLVIKIDTKLAEVNKNQTARFTEILGRLQMFLDKINRSATGKVILADATAAQAAIDLAKTAVDTQVGKTYTMTITDDVTLKINAGTTVSQLRQDLMIVYKLVIDAKQAVHKLSPEKTMIKKEATRSANL